MTLKRLVKGLSSVFITVGIVGTIVHGALSTVETSVLVNQFLGLWGAIMLAFSGFQLFQIQSQPDEMVLVGPLRLFFSYFYFGEITIASFIMFIGYAVVGGNTGAMGAGWAFVNFVANVLIIAIFQQRRYLLARDGQKILAGETANRDKSYQTSCCFRYCNGLFRLLHFVFWAFLAAGAIVSASVMQFKPRGTVYDLKQSDGRQIKIHIYCQGPTNSSQPVIWIVADPAHGVVDFYGVQQYLAAKGRRVCTQDNPGFGWSSDALKNQTDFANLFYDEMFEASGEGFPIILAPWGGGASPVVKYAKQKPERVKAIVLLTVYSPGIEFETYKAQKGLSESQLESYRKVSMMGRLSLARIILGLGAPWGLMPIFVPMASVSKGYEPKDRATEFRVQLWTHRMWTTQYWGIKRMISANDREDPLFTMPLAANISLTHVLCKLNDTQVCKPRIGFNPTPEECKQKQFENQYQLEQQEYMTKNLTLTAQMIYNVEDDCNLGLPVDKPAWTAQAIYDAVKDDLVQ